MLTEPNRNRSSILEAHHTVLPIPNMIPKQLTIYIISQVESVKIHIESINKTVAMVVDDDSARSHALGLAGNGIWQRAVKPRWIFGRIDGRSEVYGTSIEVLTAVSSKVELFEVGQEEWRWHVRFGDRGEVECGVGVVQLRLDV